MLVLFYQYPSLLSIQLIIMAFAMLYTLNSAVQ